MNDWFDWLLNIAIVLAVGGFSWRFIRSRSGTVRQFDINEGNQSDLIHSVTVSREQLNAIARSRKTDGNDAAEDAINEYTELLFDSMTKNHSGSAHSHEFWLALTRGQKVFWSYLIFEGDVDNGGLFQFMNNYPEQLHAVRQVMVELKQEQLLNDYDVFLKEVADKQAQLRRNNRLVNAPFSSQEKRLQAFSDGYKILQTPALINAYFYTEAFKSQWHKAMCDYIEEHIDQFALTA
jgi:hypothetical protein